MFQNLPTPQTILASSSNWFVPFMNDWMWIVYVGVGVLAVGILIRFLIGVFENGIQSLTTHTTEKKSKGLKLIEVPGGWDVDDK